MPSYKISATISDKEAARTLSGALSELVFPPPDAMTMFEAGEDWLVEGYYNEAPDLQGLSHQLGAVLPFPVPPLRLEEVPDENWVAISQAALPPVTAGRFIVHGSHDIGRVPRGPNTLLIDAGEAFGTAHHATTQGCLMALDELSRKRQFERVLDLGCGSGVLAIAASRVLRGAQIDASDNDPVAIAVARSNARRNGAATCIRMRVAEGIPRGTLPGTYDLILANILARSTHCSRSGYREGAGAWRGYGSVGIVEPAGGSSDCHLPGTWVRARQPPAFGRLVDADAGQAS